MTSRPGAGRAKLRLSRGFPRGPAFEVSPQQKRVGGSAYRTTRPSKRHGMTSRPGAGRVRLRLSRGFPRGLAFEVSLANRVVRDEPGTLVMARRESEKSARRRLEITEA
jgi:hypothetical protein